LCCAPTPGQAAARAKSDYITGIYAQFGRLDPTGTLRSQAMSDKEERQVPLKLEMIHYLDEVAKAYKLDDAGKAMRCS